MTPDLDLTLVPPGRLGTLLTERRTALGLSVEEITGHADLPFSADELRSIEQGQVALNDHQVSRLLRAYETYAGQVIPGRAQLVVDVSGGTLGAGQHQLGFTPEGGVDDVLGRYLSLLYLLRGLEPGSELSLRDDDMAVLSEALQRNIQELEQRLFGLMLPGHADSWFHRLRHRVAVPAAGLLVGLTAVGSLVLIDFPGGERPTEVQATGTAPSTAAGLIVIGDAELAPATSLVRADNGLALDALPGSPQAVGLEAEALLTYDIRSQLQEWTIEFDGPRDGYRGNTNTVTRTITVYVSAGDSAEAVAGVLAHEAGHAIDVMYLDDAARQQWLDARGIDAVWWPESGGADFSVGAGDFAEAVAVLIAGSPSDSDYGEFTSEQLSLARTLLP